MLLLIPSLQTGLFIKNHYQGKDYQSLVNFKYCNFLSRNFKLRNEAAIIVDYNNNQ